MEGGLAQADFECPTHPIAVEQNAQGRLFRLAGGAGLMDRDFALILKEPESSHAEGYWTKDGKAFVALASFHPGYDGQAGEAGRTIKLVLDCSGSMSGDSMRQAKAAVSEIIAGLKGDDRFNITVFGSDYRLLFPSHGEHRIRIWRLRGNLSTSSMPIWTARRWEWH